jgi:fatty acid elongase 3
MSTPDWIQVGPPTIDRPFGLQLWPVFEKAYESALGYKPQDFRFEPGETPISTLKTCSIILLSYYFIIFGGRELMRNRPAMELNFLFKLHNFYLTAISAILLGLFAEQIIPTVWRHGLFFAICDHAGGWTDKMVILYYLNYLTKFLELLDTCFLFLKKKPLSMERPLSNKEPYADLV